MAAIPVPGKGELWDFHRGEAVASEELGTRAWVTDFLVAAIAQLLVS